MRWDRTLRWVVALGLVGLASWSVAGEKKSSLLGRKKVDPNVTQASAAAPRDKWTDVVATVNGEEITREQLADELLATHGRKQLDLIINRKVIEQAAKEKNVEVTRADVEADLQENLKRFNLKRKEFIEQVLGNREITYPQYVRDTVWPALALKKLVADKVEVADEDLAKAFEANYGEKVDVRMLVVLELRKIQELWEEVHKEKDPQKRLALFEDLCKTHSIDQATRAFGGKTQPIHRHTGYPELEQLAFSLKKGELSKIVQLPEGNVVLLCVDRIPARTDITMDTPISPESKETVRDLLRKDLHEKKVRIEVATFFKSARDKAVVKDFMSGEFDAEDLKAIAGPDSDADPNQTVRPSPNAN